MASALQLDLRVGHGFIPATRPTIAGDGGRAKSGASRPVRAVTIETLFPAPRHPADTRCRHKRPDRRAVAAAHVRETKDDDPERRRAASRRCSSSPRPWAAARRASAARWPRFAIQQPERRPGRDASGLSARARLQGETEMHHNFNFKDVLAASARGGLGDRGRAARRQHPRFLAPLHARRRWPGPPPSPSSARRRARILNQIRGHEYLACSAWSRSSSCRSCSTMPGRS